MQALVPITPDRGDHQQLGRPTSGRANLSDVILYLLTKEAAQRGSDFKIPLSRMSGILVSLESQIRDLGIPIRFDITPVDVSSRQVDQALFYLIPYSVKIDNPSFSLRVTNASAVSRLAKLERRIPPRDIASLKEMYSKFHAALGSSEPELRPGRTSSA